MNGLRPRRPLLAVPNVTAHPSTASVPITVRFNVAVVKGLKAKCTECGTSDQSTIDAALDNYR